MCVCICVSTKLRVSGLQAGSLPAETSQCWGPKARKANTVTLGCTSSSLYDFRNV